MSSGLKLDRADTTYAEKAHELSIKNRKLVEARDKNDFGEDRRYAPRWGHHPADGQGSEDDKGNRVRPSDSSEEVHKLAIARKDGVLRYDVDEMNGKKKAAGTKKRK